MRKDGINEIIGRLDISRYGTYIPASNSDLKRLVLYPISDRITNSVPCPRIDRFLEAKITRSNLYWKIRRHIERLDPFNEISAAVSIPVRTDAIKNMVFNHIAARIINAVPCPRIDRLLDAKIYE